MSSVFRTKIAADQIQAMKEKDEARLSTLRMLSAALKNSEIEKQQTLDDSEVESVITRQVKQLQDAAQDYKKGGREDLVLKTEKEIVCLQTYLPEQMSREEVIILVRQILANNNLEGSQDIGKAMGIVMKELKGKADGNLVREIVSEIHK